jgi:hypothetical protein
MHALALCVIRRFVGRRPRILRSTRAIKQRSASASRDLPPRGFDRLHIRTWRDRGDPRFQPPSGSLEQRGESGSFTGGAVLPRSRREATGVISGGLRQAVARLAGELTAHSPAFRRFGRQLPFPQFTPRDRPSPALPASGRSSAPSVGRYGTARPRADRMPTRGMQGWRMGASRRHTLDPGDFLTWFRSPASALALHALPAARQESASRMSSADG